jgi:crotonobetainyl-CoA:carnitine CoA-transferase CaiB-like acyl-CoA transferase
VPLKAELETVLRTRPTRYWEVELNRVGVPAGAVLGVPEALTMPQVADRGFLKEYSNVPGVGRDIRVATTGVKLDGKAPQVDAPPPLLGQGNAEIWGEIGVSADDLASLAERGTI